MILDCESYESALDSVCSAFSLSHAELVEFLSPIDLEREYKTKEIHEPSEDYLRGLFHSRFGMPTQEWKSACWFHLTRVPPDTDFAEGILPLHDVLPRIWETLISLSQNENTRSNLIRLRDEGVPEYQYRLKTGSRLHSGPCAMLVREAAFQVDAIGNHDYLRVPEIIEDICKGYRERYGEWIMQEICDGLVPCIVKFETPIGSRTELLRPTLMYCWAKARNEEMSLNSNTCFDGQSVGIPHSAIRGIEWPVREISISNH